MSSVRLAVACSCLVVFIAVSVGAQSVPSPQAKTELTSTGKLRVGLILSNPVLVTRDAASELRGVTIDLGHAIAARLDVSFEPVGYANPAKLAESFHTNAWDIAFIAIDPARAAVVDFTPAYMEVDNSYLVPAGSRIATIADADQPGIRIGVPEKSVPDLYLSRTLKHAELVRVAGGATAAVELLSAGKADAFAENANMLLAAAAKLPGSHVLEGRYTVVQHGIALPKDRPAAHEFLKHFVEAAKASGLVQQAIDRVGLQRVHVPGPAQ